MDGRVGLIPLRRWVVSFNTIAVYLVVLVLLGSAVLGVIRLRETSFWYDEVISIDTVKDYATTAQRFPEQMPAYFVVLSGWLPLVGDSEVAGRWLSLLFGLLTLAFTYQLAKHFGSRQAGLLSLIALAASAFFVRYDREMRPYTFLACFASASMWYYLKWLERQRRSDAVLYIITTSVLLFTHFFAGLVVAVQGLYFLLNGHPIQLRPRFHFRFTSFFWRTIGLHLITFLIVAPYLPTYMAGLRVVTNNGRYLQALSPAQALDTITQALTNDNLGLFILLGLVALGSQRRLLSVVLLWLFIPLGVVLLVQTLVIQVLSNPRYLIFVWPAAAILIGMGISVLPSRLKFLTVGVVVSLGIGQVINNLPSKFPGVLVDQPWRELFQTIGQEGAPSDLVLVDFADLVGLTGYREPIAYYAQRYRPQSPSPILLDGIDPPPPPLSNAAVSVQGVWLLVTDGDLNTHGREAVSQLGQMGFAQCQAWSYDNHTTLSQWQKAVGPFFTFGQIFSVQQMPLNPTKAIYQPGDSITLNFGWHALQTPRLNYSLGVYVLDNAGQIVFQQDGPPAGLQTSSWQPGQNFCDSHHLRLPDKPGNYAVQIAVYDSGSGQRLTVQPSANESTNRVTIFKFSIQS